MTADLVVGLLGLLPESALHSGWFAVLAAFVAINTVMYVVLATATMLPKVHVSDWFTSRDRRTLNRTIYPDPGPSSTPRPRDVRPAAR